MEDREGLAVSDTLCWARGARKADSEELEDCEEPEDDNHGSDEEAVLHTSNAAGAAGGGQDSPGR